MNSLVKYLIEVLETRENHYRTDPTSILEHYNTEQQNIEAYNGRQLLEMLQNADDACEIAHEKKVLVKLDGRELIIANNGESFTEDGLRSILYISVSSKTKKRNKIGHKGLGFRSILSWADEVTITSGGIKISFSPLHAKALLQKIIESNPSIADFLAERSNTDLPIAILRVPKLHTEMQEFDGDFDTVVTIRLKETCIKDVQTQINTLINKETLIFLNNTEQIEIQSPERQVLFTKSYDDENKLKVSVVCEDLESRQKESKSWEILRETGVHLEKNYELAVAWNKTLDDEENVLYSYFKTEVSFPFPGLIHGTFELTPDRKNLENDTLGHNKFLTGILAGLLIKTALKITEAVTTGYSPLKLLNIKFNSLDRRLNEYGFKEILMEKIKLCKVFPTVNGNYIDYSSRPVYFDYHVANILQGEDVQNLLLHCQDTSLVTFIREFNLYHYTLNGFLSIIERRLQICDNRTLANLIYHLLTYEKYVEELGNSDFDISNHPKVLIDSEGLPIAWEANVFVRPSDGADLTLPNFLKVKFVSSELIALVRQLFAGLGQDKMMERLGTLKIKEYSFVSIAETLITFYNEKEKLQRVDVIQLHTHLFRLYKRESRNSNPLTLNIGIIPVLAVNNKVSKINQIYFGKHYGNEMADALYVFDKQKILAAPNTFKLPESDPEIIKKYFIWLGVAVCPRFQLHEISLNKREPFIEHVFRSLKYPFTKWNYSFKNYNEFHSWLPEKIDICVGVFDEMENIFKKAKLQYIFEWLSKDKQLFDTLEKDREQAKGCYVYFMKNTDRWLDKADMTSFAKWSISKIPFMPVKSNGNAAPMKCCLSKTITEDFTPFVEKPAIQLGNAASKLQLSEDVIENFVVLLGVHREISSFSVASLYEMLSSLPAADIDGKVARKIYREIINNFNESRIDANHPAYRNFLQTGKMYARKANELAYFPVNATYYLPTKSYGSNVLKRFSIAELDSKQGPLKIERLFGVKRLKDIRFRLDGELVFHGLNNEFQDDTERFKALIYVLRKDKDTSHVIGNRLKKLKIYLNVNVRAVFTHETYSEQVELEEFEYVDTKRNEFYISVPEKISTLDELRDANKFCQSIAEIFSIAIETEEYGDFIHDLYSKAAAARELRLLSYIQKDDSVDLDEAKKQLEIVDDIRFSFWRAFCFAKKLKEVLDAKSALKLDNFLLRKLKIKPEQTSLYSEIFFNALDELENLELLYNLFIEHSADYTIFARHFFTLDFTRFFTEKVEDKKIKHGEQFVSLLYNSLLNAEVGKKVKFFDHIDSYKRIAYKREMGFIKDVKTFFVKLIVDDSTIDLSNTAEPIIIEEKMESSITALAELKVNVPDELRENIKFQALLVFGEIDELKKIVNLHENANHTGGNNNKKQVRLGAAIIEFTNYESLAKQIKESIDLKKVKLKDSGTASIDEESDEKSRGGKGKRKTRNIRFDKSTEELIGFMSEFICYLKLVAKYGEGNVKWVSENASRAYPQKFMTGEAGYGYDLELTDSGKTRYIEIKGSMNIEKGILMSKEEIRVALHLPDRYDLMVVEGPLTEFPVIRQIKSPFKFRKGQSLFNNPNVSVFTENYLIKFAWDEQ